MKVAFIALVVIAAFCFADAMQTKTGLKEPLNFDSDKDYEINWFHNFIDQVDQTDKRTYLQRFWYSTEEFDTEKGPIFVYICGEYTCSVPYAREFPHQLAQKHNGLFLVLEHRYYGESQLFDDWSVENLRYLTIENALADTAMFLDSINHHLQENYGGSRRQVVVVGGSYPGAFSAWMRYKYPHVVDASISSSGVVNAILNYDMYDYQIYNSTSRSDNGCTGVIQNMTHVIDSYLKAEDTEGMLNLKSVFKAEHVPDVDFAMFFSDQFAGKVQYGSRTEMCEALGKAAYQDVFLQFNTTRDYFGEMDAEGYYADSLKNSTIDFSKSSRQWTYQTCTEVAYFQTSYEGVSMRADAINITYYHDLCEEVFGKGIWPNVHHTNLLLGETHLARTNIFFTNGVEDPWKWAGAMSVPEGSGMEAQVVDCEDCAHCVELYTPTDDDADTLKAARKRIETWLEKILDPSKASPVKAEIKKLTE